MKTFVVSRGEVGALVQFIATKLKLSKKRAKTLIDSRSVFVNGRRLWMAQHVVEAGDTIEVHAEVAQQERELSKREVLFEDDTLVIINKPAGMLSNADARSAERALQRLLGVRVYAVHRLDRDTSGCLMFAKTDACRIQLEEMFKTRQIEKIYHAIVLGKVPPHIEAIRTPVDGKPALTKVMLLSSSGRASHIKVKLETGRMHQIRKHLSSIRHPVLGDKEYYRLELSAELVAAAPRQLLHARLVTFAHPTTGEKVRVEAPLPKDFTRALKMLKLQE